MTLYYARSNNRQDGKIKVIVLGRGINHPKLGNLAREQGGCLLGKGRWCLSSDTQRIRREVKITPMKEPNIQKSGTERRVSVLGAKDQCVRVDHPHLQLWEVALSAFHLWWTLKLMKPRRLGSGTCNSRSLLDTSRGTCQNPRPSRLGPCEVG